MAISSPIYHYPLHVNINLCSRVRGFSDLYVSDGSSVSDISGDFPNKLIIENAKKVAENIAARRRRGQDYRID